MFGEHGVEELIDQGAIRFVLWAPMVLHMVDDIHGINAIASGNVNDPVHTDPEKSFELGLNWLTDTPNNRFKKALKRKVLPLYDIPSKYLSGEAVAITNSAFKSGKLIPLGFDPNQKKLDKLELSDRALLANCATGLLEYKYLISNDLTAKSEFE